MSDWMSMYAILRDLSEAQGRDVPVDTLEAVAEDDKPPVPNITEETEEEFFEGCVTGSDETTVPDLGLIQEMLTAVRLSADSNNEVEDTQSIHTPQGNASAEIQKTKGNNKITGNRKSRNLAIQSILDTIGKEILKDNKCGTKSELKTDDSEVFGNSSLKKSPTESDDSLHRTPREPANAVLNYEPVNMFRKKTPTKKVTKTELKPVSEKSNNIDTFKPSGLASEYYNKYVEKAKFLEDIKDDIWTKAEKKMKEIEAKRQTAHSSSKEPGTETDIKLSAIQLQQHRHQLPGACLVCEVVSSHGFKVNKTEQELSPLSLPALNP